MLPQLNQSVLTNMSFEISKWIISCSFRARHNWRHFRIHRNEIGFHLVWGKLSLIVDNWTLEVHPICGECGSIEVGGVGCGNESWTVCQSCQSVEQRIRYVNLKEYENA